MYLVTKSWLLSTQIINLYRITAKRNICYVNADHLSSTLHEAVVLNHPDMLHKLEAVKLLHEYTSTYYSY